MVNKTPDGVRTGKPPSAIRRELRGMWDDWRRWRRWKRDLRRVVKQKERANHLGGERPLAQAVEHLPAGEPITIDLGLGLAARRFDADRGDNDGG